MFENNSKLSVLFNSIKLAGGLLACIFLAHNEYVVLTNNGDFLPKSILFIPIIITAVSFIFKTPVLEYLVFLMNFSIGTFWTKLISMELYKIDSLNFVVFQVKRIWNPKELADAFLQKCQHFNLYVNNPSHMQKAMDGVVSMADIDKAVVAFQNILAEEKRLSVLAESNQHFWDNVWYYGTRTALVIIVLGSIYYYFTSGSISSRIDDTAQGASELGQNLSEHIVHTRTIFERIQNALAALRNSDATLENKVARLETIVTNLSSLFKDFYEKARSVIQKLTQVQAKRPGGYYLTGADDKEPDTHYTVLETLVALAKKFAKDVL